MVNNLFPYIGETILEHLIDKDSDAIMEMLGLLKQNFVSIHRNIPFIFPNTSVMFDGFSSIDLCLKLSDNTIFPIEVKLGYTGLQRATINKKLISCSLSDHKDETRIKGNTLAILNRYFAHDLLSILKNDELHAVINKKEFRIRQEWGIIARNHIFESWDKFPPKFNGKQRQINLEDLCAHFGPDTFNNTVKTMFKNVNFYKLWIKNNS
jgi:hypothetical protein